MNIEEFPTSKSAIRMINTVSKGFYDKSYVAKWLYQIMGVEVDDLKKIMDEIPQQIFPETATWGLVYHEQKWQIPIRENLSYEERRRLIYQKRDCRSPMTPYRMEKYLSDATGFEVLIADINDPGRYNFDFKHPNEFIIYFIGEGTLDLGFIYGMVNQLKQSHTTYIINDRLEAVADNRQLERPVLENIRFRITVPFWYIYEHTLDGSWPLDGSVFLDTKRSYNPILAVTFFQGNFYNLQKSNMKQVRFEAGQKNAETVKSGTGYCIYICTDIDEQTEFTAGMQILTEYGDGEVTLETKNKDRWFLDGSVLLDGSRNLDAVYRLEVVE